MKKSRNFFIVEKFSYISKNKKIMDKFYIKNLNREIDPIKDDYDIFKNMSRIELIETIIILKESEVKLLMDVENLKKQIK
jgi:hypothetical protein